MILSAFYGNNFFLSYIINIEKHKEPVASIRPTVYTEVDYTGSNSTNHITYAWSRNE